MKIVAFCGSFKKNGNTATAIKRVLAGAEAAGAETELFYLGDYTIKPCTGCQACEKTHKCVIKDDDIAPIHAAIASCDAIVVGTPTYYGDITGLFKNYVDRNYPFIEVLAKDNNTKELVFGSILKNVKPGVMVAVSGGMGEEVFTSHRKVVGYHFNDINAYIWKELLITHTTWNKMGPDHPLWDAAFQMGKDLVKQVERGEHPAVINEIS